MENFISFLKKASCVYALIVLMIALIPMNAFACTQDKKITSQTEWIIITDSYGVTPLDNQTQAWPFQFQKMMGLRNDEVCFLRLNGYGYAKKNKQFLPYIKKLSSSKKVKRIIINGAVTNDKNESLKSIKQEMSKINSTIKKKYPNAKIYFAASNWDIRHRRHAWLTQRKADYKKLGTSLGWKWLKSISNALVKEDNWCLADYHHPNAKGGKLIAEEAFYAFRGYKLKYKIRFLPNGGTGKIRQMHCEYNKEYVLPKCIFTKNGYTLSGWISEEGDVYKPGQTVKRLSYTQDVVTLSAVWKRTAPNSCPFST